MISGYLYFNKCTLYDGFNKEIYVKKTKGRIKSLLIPYLLWNLLVFLLFTVMQSLTSGSEVMQKEGYKALVDYELIDYLKNFWALDSTGMPVDGPLWFIRDLFVMSLFTPLLYLGIKYLRWTFVVVLIFISYLELSIYFPFINYTYRVGLVEVYFTLGASFMLLAPDVPAKLKNIKYLIPITTLALIAIVGLTYSVLNEDKAFNQPFIWLYRIFGSFLFFAIAELLADKGWCIATWLSTSSFFIFAIHKPILVIIRRFFFAIFHPTNEIVLTSLIFIIPTVVILLSLLAFYIIKRWMPWLKCLNGYRL